MQKPSQEIIKTFLVKIERISLSGVGPTTVSSFQSCLKEPNIYMDSLESSGGLMGLHIKKPLAKTKKYFGNIEEIILKLKRKQVLIGNAQVKCG